MSSLFDSLSEGKDIQKVSEEIGEFPIMLGSYRDRVVTDYNRYNVELNQGIAKIAKTEGLNDNQIQRIVEEVNNQVYLEKYAKMRNSPDRDVVFDLASTPDVRSILDGKAKPAEVEIEKKASWEDGSLDKLNFLNFSSNESQPLAPEKSKPFKDILAEKLAFQINEVENKYDKAVKLAAENIYTIAEALIKYDRSYKDAQDIFGQICKSAKVSKSEQSLYKKAVDQKISQMKEVRQLPENYSLNLELIDMNEQNEFSLGEYSMIKSASKDAEIPPIVTDNGAIIKNVQDLISIAGDIKKQRNEIFDLADKKKKISTLEGGR